MRWIFRLLGVLILVAVFAVGAVVFLPKERIAAIAADQVRAQTGRDLYVAGEIGLSVWPVLGVRTGAVTFSNADWAGDAPMVEAESLAIGIDARALLTGDIRIRNIEAIRPVVRLSTRADGTGNWVVGPATRDLPAAPGPAGANTPITLERLKITDARLVYSPAGGTPVDISGVSLTLDWPEAGGPAQLEATLNPTGGPVTVSARIDTFDAFLGGGISPVEARVEARGGETAFIGRASLDGEAAGDLTLSTGDTAAFFAALGADGIRLPRGLGQSIQARGGLTITTDRRLTLRALDLALDGNRITGDADIDLSGKPRITAQLAAGLLDLSPLTEARGGGGAAPAPTAAAGWSTEPIDASALGLADAQLALSAGEIRLGDVAITDPQLALSIDRARAVLQISRAGIFDGVVTGQLVANNRSGLSVGGTLTASGIEAQSVLSKLAGLTRLSGKAEAGVEFLGVGQSVDAIMKSLSGRGSVSTGRGVISGIDLDRLIRTGTGSGGTTVFDSLSADFTMERGDLRNDNLLILLANFRAEGAGRVGLGARDIDYLFTPIALRANSGQGLAIPIRITGPWSDPRIVPDLEQALRLDTSGKVEEVKREAEQRIERKLQEELGVTVQEGQSTEDAVKDALEEKAKDRLRRLLGGN